MPNSKRVIVIVPDEIPELNASAARTLLAILIEATTIELLDDEPSDGDSNDDF